MKLYFDDIEDALRLKNGFSIGLEIIDDVDEAILHETSEVALSLGYSF